MRLIFVVLAVGLFLAGCTQEQEAPWWKGNLHTHSLWSDGDAFPEVIVGWYKTHGYDFVALSDHNTLAEGDRWVNVGRHEVFRSALAAYRAVSDSGWVETRQVRDSTHVRLKTLAEYRTLFEAPNAFLVLQAEEITDRFEDKPVHINATNLVDHIAPQGGTSVQEVMQRNIDAVLAQRARTGRPMIPHLNHPNFIWGVSVEDLLGVEGERFFEVYNGHPLVHNEGDSLHPGTEEMWDILLTARLKAGRPLMYGLATDDAHNYGTIGPEYSNTGRGWIVVQADSLRPAPLIEALEAGRFYASTGVELVSLDDAPGVLGFKIKGEPGVTYTTTFIGTRRGEDAPVGEVLAQSESLEPAYHATGDELYVRARVNSSKPKENVYRAGEVERAWIQPLAFGAGQ